MILQDSIDLFLGNFAVDETDGPTPLRVQKDWKFLTVSIFLCRQQDPVGTLSSSFFSFLLAVAHHYAGGIFHVHCLSSHGW